MFFSFIPSILRCHTNHSACPPFIHPWTSSEIFLFFSSCPNHVSLTSLTVKWFEHLKPPKTKNKVDVKAKPLSPAGSCGQIQCIRAVWNLIWQLDDLLHVNTAIKNNFTHWTCEGISQNFCISVNMQNIFQVKWGTTSLENNPFGIRWLHAVFLC